MEDKVEKKHLSRAAKEREKERILKNEKGLKALRDNIKSNNIYTMEIPEGEESEQRMGNLSELIMTEHFPNLVKKKRHTSPGSTQSSKKDELKETHIKTS